MTLAKRKSATKAQQAYQDRAREIGCVVCRFRIESGMQDEKWGQCGSTHIHHRNLGDRHGAKQLGQDAVVAMGAWHHQGRIEIEWPPLDVNEMRDIYGPSFALHARDFRAWTSDVLPGRGYGTEAWQSLQDEMLGEK